MAVDLYNRTAAERSLEAFVVHMHLAWLYLLHAKFERDDVDYRYWVDKRRLERMDGEPKTWELARSLSEALPDKDDPVRRNVEFFIKIRNKIEHRYEKLLATVLAGKTQSNIMNYEEMLTTWFGVEESLGDSLRFPVFMSTLTPGAVEALKATYRRLPHKLTAFIREQDAALPDDVAEDWRYEFRVFLMPQTGPKTDSDVVMRFIREEEMTDDQRRARDVVQTIVRTKEVPVQNKGRYKPSMVARLVSEALGVRFSIFPHHVAAWRYYKVRPGEKAEHPALTDTRYCVWDEPHRDYLYTDAWVKKLIRDLTNPETFERVTGRVPESRPEQKVPLPGGSVE